MKYHHGISLHRRRRYIRRVLIFCVILACVSAVIILAIRLDSYFQDRANTAESTTSKQTTAYYSSSDNIFSTDYFKIQAPKNWAEIPSESGSGKFVYRGMNKTIVEEELIVYVNDIPGDLSATRLLPVRVTVDGRELSPGSVSGHCNEASKDRNIDQKIVQFEDVRINCDIDNTQFNVLAGMPGGSTRMTLKRPGGGTAEYSILYRNVEAVADVSDLIEIMHTFQTR